MRKYSPTGMTARLEALKTRHLNTSNAITREGRRPDPDIFLLKELKRRRLRLKNEIAGHSFA